MPVLAEVGGALNEPTFMQVSVGTVAEYSQERAALSMIGLAICREAATPVSKS